MWLLIHAGIKVICVSKMGPVTVANVMMVQEGHIE